MKTNLLMLAMLSTGLTASAAVDLHRAEVPAFSAPAGAMCAKNSSSSVLTEVKRMSAPVSMKGPAIGDGLTLDPKTLTYLSPDPFYGITLYGTRAMNGKLDVMAGFDVDLTARFSGNRINTINVVLDSEALLGATVFIKDANFETVFEQEVDVDALDYFEIDMTGTGTKYQVGKLASIPTDYVIDGKPIYVGYQVKVDPEVGYGYFSMLAQLNAPHSGCCVIERYDGIGPQNLDYCVPFIWCDTEGDGGLLSFDVAMNGITDMRALCDTEYMISGTLTNFGTEPVENITFSYTGPDGSLKERTLQSSEPLPYMTAISFNIPITSNAESGFYDKLMEVADINGHKDELHSDNSTTYSLIAIDEPVDRTLLVEDFTGEWCGFCTRGMAAFTLLHEMYPDNCITTNFHIEDSMSVNVNGYDVLAYRVPGYPEAFLNHVYMVDPWSGIDPQAAFGMGDLFETVLRMPVEIAIDGEAVYDPESGEVSVKTILTPTLDVPDASVYRVGFTIVEDGYTGVQSNMYSEDYGYWSKEQLPEAMWPYYDLPGAFECEYEDVVRDGYNVLGSVEPLSAEPIEKGACLGVTTVFPTSNVADFSKASLVAYVMDASSTEVLDAVKLALNAGSVGTESITVTSSVVKIPNGLSVKANGAVEVAVYSLDGIKVAETNGNDIVDVTIPNAHGVYIVTVSDMSGKTVSKVIF